MKRYIIMLLLLSAGVNLTVSAQDDNNRTEENLSEKVPITYYRMAKKEWYIDDSITVYVLPEIPVYAPLEFKNQRETERFNRLVYNIKKTLPIAKRVNMILLETYETLEKLPDQKSKDEHLKAVEKDIKEQYTPLVKKLTLSQGKLLIKLIHRECNQSAYRIINTFFGTGKSWFYQSFAILCGASLNKKYDPENDDRMVERVVRLVEVGAL